MDAASHPHVTIAALASALDLKPSTSPASVVTAATDLLARLGRVCKALGASSVADLPRQVGTLQRAAVEAGEAPVIAALVGLQQEADRMVGLPSASSAPSPADNATALAAIMAEPDFIVSCKAFGISETPQARVEYAKQILDDRRGITTAMRIEQLSATR